MRTWFGLVQRLDGAENTEPNARGAIEAILADLDHDSGRPSRNVRSPTGEISLFRLHVAPALENSHAPPATAGFTAATFENRKKRQARASLHKPPRLRPRSSWRRVGTTGASTWKSR